jgi:hypothetical protein
MKPTPAKPRIIIAHVDDSGTALIVPGRVNAFVPKLNETLETVSPVPEHRVQANVNVPVPLM